METSISLTVAEIEDNKRRFIDILNSINRNFDKDKLIDFLNNSDFFIAPASTKFHGAFAGGLCSHCLKVYDSLMHIYKHREELEEPLEDILDSIKIVALFHDISKRNTYKLSYRNKKIYCESEEEYKANPKDWKLYDNLGNFKWVSVEEYVKRDTEELFIYGNHEETSEFMISKFIPLTVEESVAILNHMGSVSYDSKSNDIGKIYSTYPLACALHCADMIACYMDKT